MFIRDIDYKNMIEEFKKPQTLMDKLLDETYNEEQYKEAIESFINSYIDKEYYIPTAINMLNLCGYIRIHHFDFYKKIKNVISEKYDTKIENPFMKGPWYNDIYFLNSTIDFVKHSFEKDSIYEVIKNDRIEDLITIVGSIDFNFDSHFKNYPDHVNHDYLNMAAYFGSVQCFKYFLVNKHKIPFDTHSYACAGGNYDIIHNVEYNLHQDFTENDLNICYYYHHDELADYIMDNYLETPFINFFSCIRSYNYRALQLHFIQIDYPSVIQSPILNQCINAYNIPPIEYLFSQNIDPLKISSINNYSILENALISGLLGIIMYVHERLGLYIDNNRRSSSLLYHIINNCPLKVIKYLINSGCMDINYQDDNGDTLINHAARKKRVEVIDFILKNKNFDQEVKNNACRNCLFEACLACQFQIGYYLYKNGIDYTGTDDRNQSLLYYLVVSDENVYWVKELCEKPYFKEIANMKTLLNKTIEHESYKTFTYLVDRYHITVEAWQEGIVQKLDQVQLEK